MNEDNTSLLNDGSLEQSFEQFGGSTALLQKVLDTIPMAVFWKDRQSVYLGCNRHFAGLAGLTSPLDIIGKTDYQLPWDRSEADFYRECDQRIMASGIAETGIVETLVTSEGNETWIETNKVPFSDDSLNVIGILGTFQDITRLKEAETVLLQNKELLEEKVVERTTELKTARDKIQSQLEEKNATLARLNELQQQLVDASRAAGMSEMATCVLHDIGNIMNSINVSADLIRNHFEKSTFTHLEKISNLIAEHEDNFAQFVLDDARGVKIPSYIVKVTDGLRSERMSLTGEFENIGVHVQTVNQIVAKQQGLAKVKSVTKPIELDKLFADVIAAKQSETQALDIAFTSSVCENIKAFSADQYKLFTMLVQLVENAIESFADFNQAEPKISLTAKRLNDQITIDVTDNGPGIPNDKLVKIFAHGFSTKESSDGFGLHNCGNIARELGGSLTALPAPQELGAVFQITIPAYQEPSNANLAQ